MTRRAHGERRTAYIGRNFSSAILLAVGIAFLVAISLSAQLPPRDTRPAPPAPAPVGTASIDGVVMSDDAAPRPLRLAYVVLIGAGTGTLKVTSTDASGHFTFANLPADHYLIGASKPPFLGAVAGARRPARAGTPIALGDGQRVENVTIKLPPAASISGTLFDERGQLVANAFISAQQWRMQNGDRWLMSVTAGVSTDERGRYRVYGLTPGEYVLSATRSGPQAVGVQPLTEADVDLVLRGGVPKPTTQGPAAGPGIRIASTYFPGTLRANDATPIIVTAGEERQAVDFRLEPPRYARVEGSVITADGQIPTLADIQMRLTIGGGGAFASVGLRPTADGRFAFGSLSPGSYLLIANGGGPQAGQLAVMPLEIDGSDQLGLQLTLRPPINLSARIAFAGSAAPPPLAGRNVPVRKLTNNGGNDMRPTVTPTRADGTFDITRVTPGRYVIDGPLFFGATSGSMTWTLDSVVVDGKDVTDLAIDISPERAPKEIVLTYGDEGQEIMGHLLLASGAAATEYTIVLFPADKAYWLPASRRIAIAKPGTDGGFAFGGRGPVSIPAGEYRLAAVADIDRDEQYDPAFLSSLVNASVPVTLARGERKVQDLRLR